MQQQFIVSLGFLEGILFSASQNGSVRTELWNFKSSVDVEKKFQCGNTLCFLQSTNKFQNFYCTTL